MDTLGAMVHALTEQWPGQPALTCGDRRLTFAELDARSSQVANALLTAGVGPGDRVGILARNRPEYFEVLFGVARTGAVLVGLNWRLAPAEIAAIVADAEPTVLLVDATELPLVPAGAHRVITFDEDYEPWIGAAPAVPPDVDVRDGDPVLQLYSSGTTGAPKGAVLTHANLSYTPRMGREFYGMGPDSVNLLVSPLFHIGGIGYGLTTLGQGGHTVLMTAVDPAEVLRTIEAHRMTHAFLVPAIVQALLTAPGVESADLSSLRVIAYGGAPMNDPLLLQAIEVFGCRFMGVYGMTETAGTVVSLAPADHDPGGPRGHLLHSVGLALPWHDVAVVDPLTGAGAAPGDVGEIWVRSGQNMTGYWNRAEATAETLVADGWLRTGDAAYRDEEGYFYLHDRIKDMIISGGENIYPAEVENVLYQHPVVADLAVIGVPDDRWGETVKAIVVREPGVEATAADVIAFARERLAHYKCPTSVDFADELPRNASGKILKKVLREPYWPG